LPRVKMLGRRDDYGVYGRIVQQTAVIGVDRRVGCDSRGSLQTLGKDVGESRDLSIGASPDMINQLHAAIARTDNTNADTFVGPEDTGWTSGQRSG
jgi:hypothetical protein